MTILPCPRSRTSHSWRAGSASCCMESLLAKMWGLPAPGRLLYQTRINQKPPKSKAGASGQGLLTGSKSAGRITTYGRATPIPRGANTVAVLTMLEAGHVLQHNVVLREGATVAELAGQLAAEGLAGADDVVRAARDALFLRTLNVSADSLEGYLFPDTYQFVKGMTPDEILARMVARMRERVSPDVLTTARARDLSF